MKSCLRAFVSVLIFGVYTTATLAAGLLMDAGFEAQNELRNTSSPWIARGTQEAASFNASNARSGKRSLLLDTVDKAQKWVVVEQKVNFEGSEARLIEASAWFKVDAIQPGVAGLMVEYRADGDERPQRVSSFATPLAPGAEWARRSVQAYLPASVKDISVSVALGTAGTMRVDDVQLDLIPLDAPREPLSREASEYLRGAIDVARDIALNRASIDWSQVTKVATAMSSGAKSTADTYSAIEFVVRQLRDGHSHFVRPSQAQRPPINWAQHVSVTQMGTIGVVMLPPFFGSDEAQIQSYVTEHWKGIQKVTDAKVCGWVVDLTRNAGGNIAPMLAALYPFIGSGQVAQLVGTDYRLPIAANASIVESAEKSAGAPAKLTTAPLAILLAKETQSSGELSAIALSSRPGVRSFGQNTAGLTTGVKANPLSDGASLNIAGNRMADVRGQVFNGPVKPDEPMATKDEAAAAAIKWLTTSQPCLAAK